MKSISIIHAIQRASAASKGIYAVCHVSDEVKLITHEDVLEGGVEVVAILKPGEEAAIIIKGMSEKHRTLSEELASIYDMSTVDGLIAQAAREWVYA